MMSYKTMFCTLEGPANALATNREANQVVVAGRNVFKIFSIEEEEFVEKLNLRVAKNLNLNYSCADVVWNAVEDHILATAATNGAVLTWNVNKTSRSKQDMIFQDHKRTVNKVSFHTTEPHLLLSGSQDGTMKCFDLRKREAASTFHSLSESVRDVQFSPHQYFVFAAVQENGNVQIWDLRRPDRHERQFTAHNGPVFSCSWHPEDKKWLATAGRDKAVKVWDVGTKPVLEHCIQTIASVAHIKWRPKRKHNIASSSLVVDFSINTWDIRRPYIPFAAFNEHKDVATGFAWRNDPHVLLSTSKDCTLYQHIFRDAGRPADHAPPVGLCFNRASDIGYSVSDRILADNMPPLKTPNYSSTRFPIYFRKSATLVEQFSSATSFIMTFSKCQSDCDSFVQMAERYLLRDKNKSFAELCDINAGVALDLNRIDLSQFWKLVKAHYQLPDLVSLLNGSSTLGDTVWSSTNGDRGMEVSHDGSNHHSSRHNSGNTMHRGSRHVSGAPSSNERQPVCSGTMHGGSVAPSDADSDLSDEEHDRTLTNIVSERRSRAGYQATTSSLFSIGRINTGMGSNMVQGDFFFGDGDTDNLAVFEFNSLMPSMDNNQEYDLPTEAFQPRHNIRDYSPPDDVANVTSSPTSFDEEEYETEINANLSDVEDHSKFLTSSSLLTVPSWNCQDTIRDLLLFLSDRGDVQTAVSMLIILGDRIAKHIDDIIQEHWFTSYIDLLHQYKLWNVANTVIQLSGIPVVNSLNQQSTVIQTQCASCKKPLNRSLFCPNCRMFPAQCSVCHEVVRGQYTWCQGCCHGGHLQHIMDWLETHSLCPTGCGHKCEYT